MTKRNIFLHDIPMDEAWGHFRAVLQESDLWQPFEPESIPLNEALGRVTGAAVWAKQSAPHYHASAMDGYAVRADDTVGASERAPITLTLVEDTPEDTPRPAAPVDTGAPLPLWADTVIMIEHVTPADDPFQLEIRAPAPPWQHVRKMGEDMVATELVLPANHQLRPVDLGAIAGCGYAQVDVRQQPRVVIIPTGNELMTIEEAAAGDMPPGAVIEYNSLVLASQIEEWGGVGIRHAPVKDDPDALKEALYAAAQNADLVLINAGSSAGSKDFTAHVVGELGDVLVHGVAVRPGHPVIMGVIEVEGRVVPVIGVPGYPVSAALTGEIFIEPLLRVWLGLPEKHPITIEGEMTRKVFSSTGDDEFMRVTAGQVGERMLVTPLSRGAGVISSLVRADGIVHIPRFSEGLDAGDQVQVNLYRHPEAVKHTILVMGSHDVALDLLAQHIAEGSPGIRLVSNNVGSLAGLIALKRGEAHLAGAHLLDPASGAYNWPYIGRYLDEDDVTLITFVEREQGLIVRPGNPLDVHSVADLSGVRFINRQRGSGTRLLLDYQLEQAGIAPEQIDGYEREETSHLGVAAAIASGTADCGMGVRAAADALGLDFVPVGWERYDLIIPTSHYDNPMLAALRATLHDEAFRAEVDQLPGYRTDLMGTHPG